MTLIRKNRIEANNYSGKLRAYGMTSKYTRTGARRSGDDYQDIIALDELVEMIKHPARYKWIQVEADDAGFLDDIVALKSDDKIIAKQVKFSTNSDNEDDFWTLEKLLIKEKGKDGKQKMSLLEKWEYSFNKLKIFGSIHDISVISNRRASSGLKNVLSPNGTLDFDKISNPEIRKEIINQLGDESKAREFFLQFHFYLDEQGLEEKEQSIRRKFKSLGGTPEGWLKLKDQLRYWIRNRNEPLPDGKITLEDVKCAALWYQLQSMPQRFEIPKDYVIPSEHFHQGLLDELSILKKGCIALTASPGVGKSTYLSYLFNCLEKGDYPVIRHHYFLSFSDRTIERLNYLRIAESLMSDLEKKYFKALSYVRTENPNPRELRNWIEKSGEYFLSKSKKLIIIIDGLDHVLREKGSRDELDKLFEHLLPVPEGVIIIVGTQPVDDSQLPSRLIRAAPKSQWKRLPLLDKSAIERWLLFHESEIAIIGQHQLQDFELGELVEAFYNKSQGHPLHLRYTFKALQDQDISITKENVEKMPSILHEDINDYYNNLWKDLPDAGRTILYLFASCKFSWQRDWIIDCLEPNGYSQIDIAKGFRQIAHLTVAGPLGIQPFHSSILAFVENQEDYCLFSVRMKKYAINWLNESAPDYWKWAYEWRLLAELGDYGLLTAGPSREWVIDALAKRYPFRDISDILGKSCWFSLKEGNLPRGIEVGLLNDYAGASYYNYEIPEKMLYSQLFLDENQFLKLILENDIMDLSGKELCLLAESQYRSGYKSVIAKCLKELNKRLNEREFKYDQNNRDPYNEIVSPMLNVAAMMDDIDILEIINFAVKNREGGRSIYILDTFCYSIRVFKRTDLIYQILPLIKNLNLQERMAVFKHVVLLALEEKVVLDEQLIYKNCSFDPFLAIYASLNGMDCFRLSNIQFPSHDFMRFDSYQQIEKIGYIEDCIYNTFFCLLANYLWGRSINNEAWIGKLNPGSPYSYKLMHQFDIIAKDLSDLIRSDKPPSFAWFYGQIGDMHKITFREDRDNYQLAVAAEKAIEKIIMDVFILSIFKNRPSLISREDLDLALKSDLFDIWRWIDNYISLKRQWMENSAVEWIIYDQISQLEHSVVGFPERASNYSILASLATLHGLKKETKKLIINAATNLLSYGWHKDIFLFHLLESIEKCHESGIGDAKQWIIQLLPIIDRVGDFTDGDETGDLPKLLASLMAKVDPYLLINYYKWLCEKDDYYYALSAFHSFLRESDLSDSVNLAVAKTGIDDESILILSDRANSGDIGAEIALSTIIDLLGAEIINYIKQVALKSEGAKINESIEPALPSPQDFPPDRLADYLSTPGAINSYFKDDAIAPWINFWRTTDRKRDAFEAIVTEMNNGTNFRDLSILFELALSLYGKEKAYQWLIKANNGLHDIWSHYWIEEKLSIKQMEFVKKYYPSKWLDFILETIKSPYGEPWYHINIYNKFPRLVNYCILLGQTPTAEKIAYMVVNFALDLISPLKLEIPEWVTRA